MEMTWQHWAGASAIAVGFFVIGWVAKIVFDKIMEIVEPIKETLLK